MHILLKLYFSIFPLIKSCSMEAQKCVLVKLWRFEIAATSMPGLLLLTVVCI